ncbi:MAG: hypothetical protein HN959_05535 [Flavobacteriaceae bacterium]|jgi:hypothetical protein|nr:hypothetical protein [Flavobacteriaceae bacterium]
MDNNEHILDGQKFIIPNGAKVKELRIELEIPKKSEIEAEFINQKLFFKKEKKLKNGKKINIDTSNVSLRTYHSIEKGEKVNVRYLKNVALLFTKLFKAKNINRYIDIKDLIAGAQELDPKTINTYIDKIRSVDELMDIIKLSSTAYKKTFFNCKINKLAATQINKILKIIGDKIKYPTNEKNYNDEKDFTEDFKILETSSVIDDGLNQLQEEHNICLYVGVLKDVPVISAEEITKVIEKKGFYDPYDNSDPLRHKIEFKINSLAEKRDYLIFNFTNCNNGSSIDVKYNMIWNFKELSNFIKKNPFSETVTREILDNEVETGVALPNQDRALNNAIVYYEFIKNQHNLPWGVNKNNFHFSSSIGDGKIIFENEEEFLKEAREAVEEEIFAEGEDRAAELHGDMLRGK